MELNISEHYHKILGHLVVAGAGVLDSISQSLATVRILNTDDLESINSGNSTREKAEVILKCVSDGQNSLLFSQCLEESAPHVFKSLLIQTSESSEIPMREDSEEIGGQNLLQNLEFISCERDLLNEDFQTISKRLTQMSEQLAQSQAESADLKRQSGEDRQELLMLRRKSLIGGGGNSVLNKMYETMLERYESLKKNHEVLQKKFGEEANSCKEAQQRLAIYREELTDIRTRYGALARDHDSLSRQFQGMNDRSESLQRDLHRVRDERTSIKREYSLVMSERDAVHKEIQKLSDDICGVNKQLSDSKADNKLLLEEKERLLVEINTLKQNQGTQQNTSSTSLLALQEELFVAQRERKQALDQYESQLHAAYMARKAQELANDNVMKLQNENESLGSRLESLIIELKDANSEAKDATRNRDMAFSEREKMRCERDEIKKTYDQLAEERERIMKQLEAEIKEHDATKEAKKRILRELRELQPHRSGTRGNVSSSGSRRDNTDSHDSAIDTCEWGSEEISTLEGGGVSRRLRTFQYKLPRQPDINLETGLFVTRSACRGITIGDRVVSINDTTVDSNNAPQLQRLVPNSTNPCVIKVMRSSSPPPTTESLNGEYGPASVDSAVYTARQNVINKGLMMADAGCQTSQSLKPTQSGHRPSLPNSFDDRMNGDTIKEMIQRNIHHVQSPSACISSGGESHQSTSTYSDSVHSSQAPSIIRHPSNPSNKSSDSSVSFQRNSSSKREKKKTKTKFWTKIGKKTKSAASSSGGTVSGVMVTTGSGEDEMKASSGGTWPRLESPPVPPFGGRLSVFTKKKSRPTISPTTFTPPKDTVGRTPPTVIRGVMAPQQPIDIAPKSFQDILQPTTPSQRPTPGQKKRPRPASVPIETGIPLSLWKDQQNASNNNNLQSPQRSNTPKSSTFQETFQDTGTVASEPMPSSRSILGSLSLSTNQTDRSKQFNQSQTSNHSNSPHNEVTATGDPVVRPDSIVFRKPDFIRQQSTPHHTTAEKIFGAGEPLSPRRQVQGSRNVTSPTRSNLQPRSAQSLPRPASAKTTSSRASSHQSIIDNPTQIKTKSLEYRRIRIPSEHSVGMKLSGSEKGSINLSDRSTPILFHNHRSHSPATPFQLTPTFHHPSTPLLHPYGSSLIPGVSPMATPLFHPTSTPLIPSPPSSIPPAPSTHLLDASVPYIPCSTLSSLSNVSTSFKARRPPVTTDPRIVRMVKSTEPIGISIVGGGTKGGIFVSRITEDSLAARAGLEYGDQLLEYNGINLRTANEEQGRAIMSQAQAGDNITFLAQYNLEKYKSSIESNLSDSFGFMKVPKPRPTATPNEDKEGTITPDTTPRSSPQLESTLRAQPIGQPRYIFLTNGCEHVALVGGNNTGIFIESVGDDGEELAAGLKTGDQVLEYNNVDLRHATLERASLLLAKPSVNTSICVYYNTVGYSKLSAEPGDFFYVRSLFDNIVEPSSGSLPFSKNSILLIDNTYPDHTMGSWSAWLVDEHGEKTTHGKIPSKFTVERESGIHRDLDDSVSYAGSTTGKKLGGTGRRSFFKRRKPHRTSSRSSGDIKLHKSVSETSIESTETSFEHMGAAYQVVERHGCQNHRPVVIFGPHSSSVCERLIKEYGNCFARCNLDTVHSGAEMYGSNVIETYKQVGTSHVLRVDTLEKEIQKHRHVLLELSQDAVDRLHSHKIYPIIVFIEYSSAKKVKESQDRIPGKEKISMKQCKDIFERANSIRKKLSSKYLGAVYIHGGSISTVAKQIYAVVDREQRKVLWLPASNDLLNY